MDTSGVQGSGFKGSRVQGSRVQGFRVQGFRGSGVQNTCISARFSGYCIEPVNLWTREPVNP
jgi:hypothetical protein